MKQTIYVDRGLIAQAAELSGISEPEILVKRALQAFIRTGSVARLGGSMPNLKEHLKELDELQSLLISCDE